jgi:hypothetical protein
VCFITAGPITKLFACGGEESGGHVLRETTSRGLYVLYQRGTGPVTKSYCGVPSLKFLLTLVCV